MSKRAVVPMSPEEVNAIIPKRWQLGARMLRCKHIPFALRVEWSRGLASRGWHVEFIVAGRGVYITLFRD